MSDLMTTPPLPDGMQAEAAAIRAALIGDRITIAQAAAAFGVTERTVYNAIDAHHIPYVKVFAVRYMLPDDLRRALLIEGNAPARGRGRPRKAA